MDNVGAEHRLLRTPKPRRNGEAITERIFRSPSADESGVSRKMSNILYFAVMVGGPKWTKVIKGKPCALGMSCINNVPNVAELPGAQLTLSPTTETLLCQTARNVDPLSASNLHPLVGDQRLAWPALAGVA